MTRPGQTICVIVAFVINCGSGWCQSSSAEDIINALKPSVKPLTRSFVPTRGVKVEGQAEISGPPSINLYINFNFDSDELVTDSQITLENLTLALQDERLKGFRFQIGGHTDAKGTEEYNEALSLRRARSVKEYLVKHGVEAGRLTEQGFGEEQLFDATKPEDGINRRVQVINVSAGS